MNEQEFLARVRGSEGLRRAVLRAVDVDRAAKTCLFELVTDTAYTEEDERAAQAAAQAAAPAPFRAEVKLIKLVADAQLVRGRSGTSSRRRAAPPRRASPPRTSRSRRASPYGSRWAWTRRSACF